MLYRLTKEAIQLRFYPNYWNRNNFCLWWNIRHFYEPKKIINIEITAFYLWFDKWDCCLCTNFKCFEITSSLEWLSIRNAMWMNMNKFKYILYKMINVVYMTLVCFIHIFLCRLFCYLHHDVAVFSTFHRLVHRSRKINVQMCKC